MSTTIKPLELYVEGTKVFPDVDVSALAYSGTDLMNAVDQTVNLVLGWKNSFLDWVDTPYILPPIDDTEWHQNSEGSIYDQHNYWQFNQYTYDIQNTLDLTWLSNVSTFYAPFNYIKTKKLYFKNTLNPLLGYNSNQWSDTPAPTLVYSLFRCIGMFKEAKHLEEIHGLNFNQNATMYYDSNYMANFPYIATYCHEVVDWEKGQVNCYNEMFEGCTSLSIIEAQWPQVFTSNGFAMMFHGCGALLETYMPTIDMQPVSQNDTINIDNLFNGCSNCTSLHITNNSWQYIKSADHAWNGTQIYSIDIPATATHLSNICFIIHEPYSEVDAPQHYSDWKYIIRTTEPMNAYLNDHHDRMPILLFNYWDWDSNTEFINTFGGIYVPDSQLSDWKTFIETTNDAPNIAQNCVHGLSEL